MTQGEGQYISGDVISILNHVPWEEKKKIGCSQFDLSSSSYSINFFSPASRQRLHPRKTEREKKETFKLRIKFCVKELK